MLTQQMNIQFFLLLRFNKGISIFKGIGDLANKESNQN